MRRNQRSLLQGSLLWLGISWLGISILALLTLSSALLGQASRDSGAAGPAISDWSNHHVVFSKPATAERAALVEKDPRYWQQIRSQSSALPAAQTDRMQNDRIETDPMETDRTETAPVLAPEWTFPPRGGTQQSTGLWSEDMGNGATTGAGNYPAKFSLNTNPNEFSCSSDFVVYSTGLQGTTGQASLVAYNNLYAGCTGTVPSIYWAYDTFAADLTSPVFWYDGTQLAVVQQNAAGHGVLMLLKWKPEPTETIAHPGQMRNASNAEYTTCTAPCKTLFYLEDIPGPPSGTGSSVFYDYGHDTAYVGDSLGYLHRFHPVFEGTPAEYTAAGWPLLVSQTVPATALTSPVHDSVTGNVFVEDKGGCLDSVSPLGTIIQSGQLDFSTSNDTDGPGFVQGPIVDSAAGLVYAFAPSDGSQSCPGGADCAAVYQLTTAFILGDTGLEAAVGNSSVETAAPNPMYIGAFNSTYLSSETATGDLYVCGNTGGAPTIYQVSIGDGVLGTVNAGPALATGTPPCSPVTDVLNPNVSSGATEWMFASATAGGVSTACASGGCVLNFKDTPWLPSTVYAVGQEIVDSNFRLEFSTGGMSNTVPPFWSITTGGSTTDHTVKWLDLGPLSATPPAVWVKSHPYSKGAEILDGNGNIELVTTAGTSGTPNAPTWNLTVGGTTIDGTVAPKVTWTNVGPPATAALAAAGGASGMIIDNTVTTSAGTSQVYFSTLSNQTCTTSGGTGGCAVQASQSTLH
jgi:hypothetical protein